MANDRVGQYSVLFHKIGKLVFFVKHLVELLMFHAKAGSLLHNMLIMMQIPQS